MCVYVLSVCCTPKRILLLLLSDNRRQAVDEDKEFVAGVLPFSLIRKANFGVSSCGWVGR